LVQMDGSFHAWLEERGPEGCLIDMVDDATNTTWAQLGEQETIWAVADTLRVWIERNGVPLALYVDWKNLYKRPATPGERLRGEEPITQFGRMCAKLDIEVIAASSAQAKGRVERVHGTHQDRLVKKLRRKEISSHEHTNVYLERDYLPEHNRRFARAAARPEDYHRRAPRAGELDRVFRLESDAGLARIGWCATTTGFFSSSRRVATTRQLRGKCWCAKGGTATSPSSIEAARCGGRRFRHPASPVWRSNGPASQFRRRPKGSGCRQRITRGERRVAERWRSACPRGPSQRGRCWPGPPLRPKRSALRAPQGCAPDQANK
jgi:hypothetical protein